MLDKQKKKVADVLAGAKESASNIKSAYQANKAALGNTYLNAVAQAKANYAKKTGTEMTASKLKSEMEGGRPSSEAREYMSNRDNTYKQLRKKLGLGRTAVGTTLRDLSR